MSLVLLLASQPLVNHSISSVAVVFQQQLTLAIGWETEGQDRELSSGASVAETDAGLAASASETSFGTAGNSYIDTPIESSVPTSWNYASLAVRWRRAGVATAELSSGLSLAVNDIALACVSEHVFLNLALSYDVAQLEHSTVAAASANDQSLLGATVLELSSGDAAIDSAYDPRPLNATETLLKGLSSRGFDIGDSRRTRIAWTDRALGYAVAPPRVKLFVRKPDGTETAYELGVDPQIVSDGPNAQIADLHLSTSGRWIRRWVAYDEDGTPLEVDEQSLVVRTTKFLRAY